MRSTIRNVESTQSRSYPKLMESETVIVLMVSYGIGVVLYSKELNSRNVGYMGNDWLMEAFSDLPEGEEITLSNN